MTTEPQNSDLHPKIQERFRFFTRKKKTSKKIVACTENIGYETMNISGLSHATHKASDRNRAPTVSFVYEEGDDSEYTLDPVEMEKITTVERTMEAHVQRVTKNDKKVKGTTVSGKTNLDPQQRKNKSNSSLTTSAGVLAFEGLNDSSSRIEYDEDNTHHGDPGKPNDDEENMVFVTVPKDPSTGLNLPICKRYYDLNGPDDEHYFIQLR